MKTPRKKIFYVPGMISAILIPLLFWSFANRKLNEPIPNVMDIGLPGKNHSGIVNNLEPFRNWNYKKIKVPRNRAKENSKFYVSEIIKLQKTNQKETGIQFILNDRNTYGDFASIINDMHISKHEYYGVDLDKTGNIFALVNYIDPNKVDEPCNLCNDVVIDNGPFINEEMPKNNSLEKIRIVLKNLPKNTYSIIFGYLILLQISILSLLRKSML